jgi:hypothetical protein
MNIYFITVNKKKYAQYKTYEKSYEEFEKLILENPNSLIEIGLEEYCEFGHLDSCCKTYNLCKYENRIVFNYYN